jgi:hypothetical protein
MKKYTPYIFPLIVVVIVFFLVYRWYSLKTQRAAAPSEFGNDIQIEEMTADQINSMLRGSDDVETTELEPSTDENAPIGRGSIRYTIEDGKVNFTVSADLPASETAYTVWVRSQAGNDLTQAFILEVGKGGYTGSASIPQEKLPLEIIVSTAIDKAEVPNAVVLKGSIAAPDATPSASPAMEGSN